MTTAYTSLLGLALPVTGELSGTWGDTVNNSITSLLDSAIAGTTTLSADTALDAATGVSNQARQAILLCTGHSANITITAPAQSKIYTVINASATYTVKIRGAGPTTGITIPVSSTATVAWNGSDFVDATNYINGNITLGSGTANGVAYLNGSKVLTTGSALVFDATNTALSVGGAALGTAANRTVFTLNATTSNFLSFGIGGTRVAHFYSDANEFAIANASGAGGFITMQTNGAEALRLTATSLYTASTINVGIGLSNPTYKLQVANYMALGTQASSGAGAGINMIPSSTLTNWFVGANYVNSGTFQIIPSTAGGGSTFTTPALTIDSSSNVGIGETNPAFRLDVANTQAVLRVRSTTGTNPVYLLTTNGGGDFYFGRENSTGSTFGSNTGYASVLYSAGAYPIVFLPNGTERMRLDSSGNLGIGNTTIGQKLAVNGGIQTNGSASLGTGFGGGAVLSFETPITRMYFGDGTGYSLAFSKRASSTTTDLMTLTDSGNLLVGTTATTGLASNTAIVAGGRFRTVSGSVSAATATATTLFTAPTALAAWLVTINVDADSILYAATYIVNTQAGSSTVATLIYKGSLVSISVSGYNIQATQTSGGTATIQYSAVRIF